MRRGPPCNPAPAGSALGRVGIPPNRRLRYHPGRGWPPGVTGVSAGRRRGVVAAKRVLLVDADGLPRRALAEQLGGLGYAVEQAGSAAAAALAIADGCDLM